MDGQQMADTAGYGTEITIETEIRGDVAIIHLGGHVTEMGADQVSNVLDEFFGDGRARLIFDLTNVKFMSSTGLGQIMRAYRTAVSNGGYVKIVNPQPLIADVFRVTKLDKLLAICDTVEEALSEEGEADIPLDLA